MYKYRDESGTVCMTNSLESVPKKYRRSMTVIKEDTGTGDKLLAPVPAAQSDPQRGAPAPAAMTPAAQPAVPASGMRHIYLKAGLTVAGLVVAFLLLNRLGEGLGFRRAAMALFVTISLLAGVFLYRSYIREVSATFTGLKENARNIKKNVETREQKTDALSNQLQLMGEQAPEKSTRREKAPTD
jgi:hypothetical protein